MARISSTEANMLQASSPLMLADHLLRLAEETDDAGFRTIAETLLDLADRVLEPRALVQIA